MNEGSKDKQLSKRNKNASTYRRVVAGNVNGKSVVQSDELMEAYQFKTAPSTRSSGSMMAPRISAKSKGLSAIRTRSFRGPAAPACIS